MQLSTILCLLSSVLCLCFAAEVVQQQSQVVAVDPPAAQFDKACTLSQIFTQQDFNALFPNANGAFSQAKPNQHAIFFHKHLLEAAQKFPEFGCTGDEATRKREVAAFLAQTSQETSNWWEGEAYKWGYFYSTEPRCHQQDSCTEYCDTSDTLYPCAKGRSYFGRGPIQLTYNYNYGKASKALFGDYSLLFNPDRLLTNPVTAFQTALWVWMTPNATKPSCHDVATGKWTPSQDDLNDNRKPGFGLITNILRGHTDCGKNSTTKGEKGRIGYYKAYTKRFRVPVGENLECTNIFKY